MLLIPVESINLYILWSDGLNLTLKDNLKEHFIKSCKKSDLSRPVIEEIQVTPAIVMSCQVFIVGVECMSLYALSYKSFAIKVNILC